MGAIEEPCDPSTSFTLLSLTCSSIRWGDNYGTVLTFQGFLRIRCYKIFRALASKSRIPPSSLPLNLKPEREPWIPFLPGKPPHLLLSLSSSWLQAPSSDSCSSLTRTSQSSGSLTSHLLNPRGSFPSAELCLDWCSLPVPPLFYFFCTFWFHKAGRKGWGVVSWAFKT